MNLLIPTYEFHFDMNINFMESFNKYCIDKNDVKIYFIVSTNNYNIFSSLMKSYDNVNVITLSNIMKKIDNIIINDNIVANKYSYQSIKKLFGVKYIEDDVLVIDSENICVKPFYFKNIIDNIKNNKKIYYSNYVFLEIQKIVNENCEKYLKIDNNKWLFNTSYWFFDSKIINDMFDYFKPVTLYDIIKNNTIFEYVLYCYFILYKKYDYKLIDMDDLMIKYLEEDYLSKRISVEHIGLGGIITEKNMDKLCQFINNENINIFRLHWMTENIQNYIEKNTCTYIKTLHKF